MIDINIAFGIFGVSDSNSQKCLVSLLSKMACGYLNMPQTEFIISPKSSFLFLWGKSGDYYN